MRAAVLTDAFRIELVDSQPAPLASDQVRIRVAECGVCASEVEVWTGKAPEELPAAIGHEVAGTVEDVGERVRNLRVGDTVAAWAVEGGFANEVLVGERFCVPVSPTVSYPAVAEPLACVVNAVELTAPALADDVVIVGAGYVGNLVQLVTALKGPRSITVADVRADALARASELGATRVADTARDSLTEAVAEVTDGRGADLAYGVTGVQAGLDLAGDVTRMGGKLAIVGYYHSVALGSWNWKALGFVNAHFRDPQTIMAGTRKGMRLVSAGVLDPAPLVTHTYPLDEIERAFETATARPEGFVTAVVHPGGGGGAAS